MKKVNPLFWLVVAFVMLVGGFKDARAQGAFEQVTGKAFDSAMPKDVYLEGNAIPTEKRNAALLKTPAGARVVFALIDTAGYSSQIKQKYHGMIIAEGKVSICGVPLDVGSYGFGLDKPSATSQQDAKFYIYNQAGGKVGECAAKKDNAINQPRPLSVVVKKGEPTHLYLGRYKLELQ